MKEDYFTSIRKFGDELDYSEKTKEKAISLVKEIEDELAYSLAYSDLARKKPETIVGAALYIAPHYTKDPLKNQEAIAEVIDVAQGTVSKGCKKLTGDLGIDLDKRKSQKFQEELESDKEEVLREMGIPEEPEEPLSDKELYHLVMELGEKKEYGPNSLAEALSLSDDMKHRIHSWLYRGKGKEAWKEYHQKLGGRKT